MANTDKNIIITPNIGSSTADPNIVFTGGNTTVANSINMTMYASGTLSWDGTAGQLFSITNSLTGTIFSVNDISGIPSITVNSLGNIVLAQYGGNVTVGAAQGQAGNVFSVAGNLYATGNSYVAKNQFVTGNIVAYGSNDLFSGKVGIGTSSAVGANANVLAIYGSADYYGNIELNNTAAGASGIYFADGTRQITAATSTSPAGADTQIQYNNAGAFGASSSLTWNGTTLNAPELKSTNSTGDEGGQLTLNVAATNTTLSTSVTIDVFQDKIRFFETGGTNRGFYLDIATAGGAGISSNLSASSGGTGGTGNYGNANVASYLSGPVQVGNLTINNTTASTSTVTGALRMGGGAGIAGAIHVGGLIYGASTLNIAGAAQVNSLISNGAITGTTGAFSTSLYSATFNTAGTATVAALASNGAITGTTGAFSTSLYSATFNTAGTATVAALASNGAITGTTGAFSTSLYGAAFNTAGTATVAALASNGAITGTTGAFSTSLYGAAFNTAGTATVAALVSNGAITATTITGTAGTFTSLQNSGTTTTNALFSNVYGRFGQNVTVNSTNASTVTTNGALLVSGGIGAAGNINAGGSRSLFTGAIGVGTTTAAGMIAAAGVSNDAYVWGNVKIANTSTTSSGILFPDGTRQTTAASPALATNSFGAVNTIQLAGTGNTFTGDTDTFNYDVSNNRLGIGTATPAQTVAVYSTEAVLFNTRAGAGARQEITVGNVTTYGAVLGYDPTVGNSIGYLRRGDSAASTPAVAWAYGTGAYRIGINGITQPQNTMDINGTVAIGNGFSGFAAMTNTNGLSVQGAVGVGTFTPSTSANNMTLWSATGAGIELASGGAAGGGNIQAVTGGGLKFSTFTGGVGLETYTNRMVIDSGGQVGIGLLDALSAFDVNGISSFRSFVSVADTAIVNALVSNVYGRFGQNVTVNSTNASTTTGTGALVITTGGLGVGGNINVGGANSLFTNEVGIGTSTALGASANALSVYGSVNNYGNIVISNTTAGGSGIYFPDGSFLTTAANTYSTFNYTGDGVTTIYSTSPITASSVNNSMVFVNGVYQRKSTYIWTGTNITFSSAPPNFATIEINCIQSINNPYGVGALTVSGALAVSGTSTLSGGASVGGAIVGGFDFTVNGGTLSSVASSQVLAQNFFTNSGNSDYLEITDTRNASGGVDWLSSGYRLQQKVDATWMGFLQFNNGGSTVNNSGGLSFGTGTTTVGPTSILERMRISATGNVAIGTTTTTQARLSVTGISGANTIGELFMTDGTQWTRMATNLLTSSFNNIVNANDHAIIYSNGTQGTGGFVIAPHAAAAAPTGGIRLDATGNVSIRANGVTVGYALDVTGSIRSAGTVIATGEITAYFSDSRLKSNVVAITNAVDKVKSINGVYYNSNKLAADMLGEDITVQRIGLLAQEVEAVLPQIVRPAPFDIGDNGTSKSGEHYKTLQYERLVPLLVEAIKEQQGQIDQLKSKITALENLVK